MRCSEWQASRLAHSCLRRFRLAVTAKLYFTRGLLEWWGVPGRLATGERTSVPKNFRTLYRTSENPSVPRLSHLCTNLKRERERGESVLVTSFSVYWRRVDISGTRYIGPVLTMHFHNILGKFTYAECWGIDTEGSYEIHTIHCVCANNAFKYRKNGNSCGKVSRRILYVSILSRNTLQKSIYSNFNSYRMFNNELDHLWNFLYD